MEQSPSLERYSFWVSPEVPSALWNQKVNHRSLFSETHQFSLHSLHIYWRSIVMLSFHLSLGHPSGFISCLSPTKTLNAPHLFIIRATYAAHPSPFDFFTQTVFDKGYRSWSSSLCSLLLPPATLFHLGPVIFVSALKHTQPIFLPQSEQPVFTLIHVRVKLKENTIVLYVSIFIFLD